MIILQTFSRIIIYTTMAHTCASTWKQQTRKYLLITHSIRFTMCRKNRKWIWSQAPTRLCVLGVQWFDIQTEKRLDVWRTNIFEIIPKHIFQDLGCSTPFPRLPWPVVTRCLYRLVAKRSFSITLRMQMVCYTFNLNCFVINPEEFTTSLTNYLTNGVECQTGHCAGRGEKHKNRLFTSRLR